MKDQIKLRNKGLKATFPRLKILNVFSKAKTRHHSAEDVYRALIAEDIDIGLATVYRVLTQFEQAGILVRSQFDGGKSVFEFNDGEHHDHLICTNCDKVLEFVDEEILERQQMIAKQHDFILENRTMILYGICPDCAKSNK